MPDVCVIRYDSERDPIRVTPALLCIEILSPKDRMARLEPRLDEFLDMGVENLWVIDPARRIAHTYARNGMSSAGSRLEIAGTPIFLDLPTLFSALD
jgi:Uma2 family endonuclease